DLVLRLRRGGIPSRHREAHPHVHSGDGPSVVSTTGSAIDDAAPLRATAGQCNGQSAAAERQRSSSAPREQLRYQQPGGLQAGSTPSRSCIAALGWATTQNLAAVNGAIRSDKECPRENDIQFEGS